MYTENERLPNPKCFSHHRTACRTFNSNAMPHHFTNLINFSQAEYKTTLPPQVFIEPLNHNYDLNYTYILLVFQFHISIIYRVGQFIRQHRDFQLARNGKSLYSKIKCTTMYTSIIVQLLNFFL